MGEDIIEVVLFGKYQPRWYVKYIVKLEVDQQTVTDASERGDDITRAAVQDDCRRDNAQREHE